MSAFAGVDTARLLAEAMGVARMNHKLIANNIANAETPNYNPARLDFQGTLRSALEGRGVVRIRRTSDRHLGSALLFPSFEPVAVLSKNDYNKVDVDGEVAALAENTSNYTIYGSLLTKHFQQIKDMLETIR
jgi:flagellar basal-body rod protein FlgB